jgi:Ca-activated chloride channel family protein
MTAQALAQFHFLRPAWLWATLPFLVLLILLWRQRRTSRTWRAVVDTHLLPYLLIGGKGNRGPWLLTALAIGGVLAVLALAGPSWERLKQPVFRQQSALVILLDLSRSMDATDVRPSRLERVRLKLVDILKKRREGQTALVAYAASAFVVTPLTTDTRTIAEQLPSLTTELMPAQGSRPDRAIARAVDLLRQAGITHGSVLLVTDGVDGVDDAALHKAVTALTAAGHRLLVLGVGTADGAPIPKAGGGFFTDNNGAIVVPKLDAAALQDVAQQGDGIYRRLTINDSDINALLAVVDRDTQVQRARKTDDLMSDQWRDAGAWLLLPLIVLASLVFRRGYLGALLLTLFLAPQSQPVMAMDWTSLWQRDDQRASQALQNGQADKAASLFQDPAWRAAAQYRAGDYEGALKSLKGVDGAEAAYNRGNALARLQRLPEALKAYEQALKQAPDDNDARHNYDLVKKALEQQQQAGNRQNRNQQDSRNDRSQGNDARPQDNGDKGQQQQGNSGDRQQSGQQQAGRQGPSSTQRSGKASNDDRKTADASAATEQQQQGSGSGQDNGADQKPQSASGDNTATAASKQDMNNAQRADVQQQRSARASADSEQQQATEQWLRSIPDDPGGLWRRKFLYQYQQQQHQGDEKQAW